MIIKDDIVYSKNNETIMTVQSVYALEDYRLKVTFSNREEKIFDFKPFLKYPVFSHLKDTALFNKCRIELGVVTWDDKTDISTDTIYLEGVAVTRDSA